MKCITLVRHCESAGQSADAPLTETGQAQALQLSQQLSAFEIDYIVSSPYVRARATIEPFAAHAGLPIHTDERLAERTLSAQRVDNWLEVVERAFEDPDFGLPGGETGREALARGWAAVESASGAGYEYPVLVSHGHLLSLILHSIDPGFGYAGWRALRNPDVYLLECERDGAFTFRRP